MTVAKERLVVPALTRRQALRKGAGVLRLLPDEVQVRCLRRPERPQELGARPKPGRYLVTPRSEHGSFEWAASGEQLLLTVFPARGYGQPVREADVRHALEAWPVRDLDENALRTAVLTGDAQPHPIARLRLPALPESGARIAIIVSADAMTARALFLGEDDPSAGEVRAALAEAGVVEGLVEKAIASFDAPEPPRTPAVVAQGRPPVPGEPARVASLVPERAVESSKEGAPGGLRIERRLLDAAALVQPGAVLATKAPATEGTPGLSVLGAELPATPGLDLDVQALAGDGCAVSADGTQLLATRVGLPLREQGVFSVRPVLVVAGDVGGQAEETSFAGDVVVQGTVRAGAKVVATGDVVVHGGVEGAHVEAGGSVLVRGRVEAQARVVAQGDVLATLVRQAQIQAGGNIGVGSEALDSTLVAGRDIVVSGRGALCGGEAVAGRIIEATTLGSAGVAVPTRLILTGESNGQFAAEERFILAREAAYAGVQVQIGGSTFVLRRSSRAVRFRLGEGEIQMERPGTPLGKPEKRPHGVFSLLARLRRPE